MSDTGKAAPPSDDMLEAVMASIMAIKVDERITRLKPGSGPYLTRLNVLLGKVADENRVDLSDLRRQLVQQLEASENRTAPISSSLAKPGSPAPSRRTGPTP